MKTYTKEQKADYFKSLRDKWQANKDLADKDGDARSQYEAMAKEGGFSYYGFYFCLMSMRANGFEGLPYVDCKTFNKWREAGFMVKKGEKAKIDGVSWVECKKDKEDEDGYLYPKNYKLFHKSQVQAIK